MSLDTIHRKTNIFLPSRNPQRTVWPQAAVAHDPVTGSPQSAHVWMAAVTHKSQFSLDLGGPPPNKQTKTNPSSLSSPCAWASTQEPSMNRMCR